MYKKISLVVLAVVIISLSFLYFNNRNRKEIKESDNKQLAALDLMNQPQEPIDKAELIDAEAVIPGANLISKNDVVLTDQGQAVKMDVMPNSPQAPMAVDLEKNQLSSEMVQIKIENNQFTPDTFTVNAGAVVSLAFISGDSKTHAIRFTDSSLAALSLGVSGGKIKAKSFNAPKKTGNYEFQCDVPGHASAGERAYMIVK